MSRQGRIAGFHGTCKRPPFFEGWYFKLVDAEGKYPLAVIPGFSLAPDAASSHSFVQILSGEQGLAGQQKFHTEQFQADKKQLNVRVGANHFNHKQLLLDFATETLSVSGEITFGDLSPWPCTPTSPGVMGWYGYAPFMECFHGVLSMDHALHGKLRINDKTVDYSGGRGYIEKDWGRSFPAAYVWMQCNHFPQAGVSFMASIAIIPWLHSSFRGFIIGLLHEGRLYRFATYTGARSQAFKITDEHVDWQISDRHYLLVITARRSRNVASLTGPSIIGMSRQIAESLQAQISISLYQKEQRQPRLIYQGTGHSAGLEVHGEINRLHNMNE